MPAALNPLPSFVNATAHDAGSSRMRRKGRKRWSSSDYNCAVEKKERLVRSCYGRDGDNHEGLAWIRFHVAHQLERAGEFHMHPEMRAIHQRIDQVMAS